MSSSSIYTTGGTVQAGGGIYLPRKADDELLQLCREGQFAYVLTPRQMGKSSLMVRTAQRLEAEGATSIIIDLTKIGTEVTAEQWYLGLLTEIDEALMLDTNIVNWWRTRQHLGVTQRLTHFFEEVLLIKVSGQLIIFVDEIDTTLGLNFTDDFFIAIRYFYVARAKKLELKKLSFVLIGVATPGNLIQDPKRTPFNIGQRVILEDFTLNEAKDLANGLKFSKRKSRNILEYVFKWTNGHPYLTQRVMKSLESYPRDSQISQSFIDQKIQELFMGERSIQDNNLQFVRDMLVKRSTDTTAMLSTYLNVLEEKIVIDEEQSLVKSHLKLSGVVYSSNNILKVRNLIYSKVFNLAWTRKKITESRVGLSKVMAEIIPAMAVNISSIILLLLLRATGLLQPLELQLLDFFIALTPTESSDPRIVILTIDEETLKKAKNESQTLLEKWDNELLNPTLRKLQEYRPSVVGVNLLTRENLAQDELMNDYFPTENILFSCTFASDITGLPKISNSQIGFIDWLPDTDGKIRRSHLVMEPDPSSKCRSSYSFPLLLAFQYLSNRGVSIKFIDAGKLQAGQTIFEPIESFSGGYQTIDSSGYQIFLNRRRSEFEKISLAEFMSSDFRGESIRDRIVIITASERIHPSMNMVVDDELVAQQVSQILSATLDGRPLISVWPTWLESLWIWAWSVNSTIFLIRYSTASRRDAFQLIVLSALSLIFCFLVFWQTALWLPAIPVVMGIFLTTFLTKIVRRTWSSK